MLLLLGKHSGRDVFRLVVLTALLIPAIATTAVGQDTDPNAAEGPGSSGVFVQDSGIAFDKLALAQRLENQKDWSNSAQTYQEIVDQYGDRVVPARTHDPNLLAQYVSIVSVVDEHLSQWPPEGLAVYRASFEAAAAKLAGSAREDDPAPLQQAFVRYFVTDAARDAGLKLIDADFERGDFHAANWIGQQLLRHPNLQGRRPMVLFRVGLAAHLSGDDASAQSAVQELNDKFPNTIGSVGGRDVILATDLQADLAKSLAVGQRRVIADDSWPTIGGDASRGKVISSAARPGATLYSIKLSQVDWSSLADGRHDLATQYKAWDRDQPGASIGVMPVQDHGELFFQDNARVYAVNLSDGTSLPGWLSTYPASGGQYVSPHPWPMPPGHQFSLTVTERVVLGVMDLPDPLGGPGGSRRGRLVCLDRASGKELWSVTPADLPRDELKSFIFGGAPLRHGNNVFISALGSKQGQDDDCYVICLDLASGRFLWSTYVASGLSGDPVLRSAAGDTRLVDRSTSLAYASGRVVVCTNFGAVAALDACTGMIDWLDIYRDANDAYLRVWQIPRSAPPPSTVPPPWTASPPIVRDGKVFVLPSDGKYLLICDEGDGHLLNKIRKDDCFVISQKTSARSGAQPAALLATVDGINLAGNGAMQPEDLLLVASRDQVCAINWRQYQPGKTAKFAIVWFTPGAPDDNILGRPFVTEDSFYLPRGNALQRFDIGTGEAGRHWDDSYPAYLRWPADEEPGNVLVSGDRVVVAGETEVSVYGSLSVAQERIAGEIAANPADTAARLHAAEVLFLADQPESAAKELDAAIELLAHDNSGAFLPVRDRAFADALSFAVGSWQPPASRGESPSHSAMMERVALADSLFDRAAALARTPLQQANYRIARARFAQFNDHDPARAIKLYQEILADSDMSAATVTAETGEIPLVTHAVPGKSPPVASVVQTVRARADFLATLAIRSMQSDPDAQRACRLAAQSAATDFQAAAAANDPDRLHKIWTLYPGTATAWSAARLAIYDFESRGMFRDASGLLRQLNSDSSAQSDDQRMSIDLTLAHDYLGLPDRLEAAEGRLIAVRQIDRAARLPFPFRLPNGTILEKGTTVNTAISAVDRLAVQQALNEGEQLPEFDFPSPTDQQGYVSRHPDIAPLILLKGTTVIPNVDRLLAPEQRFARNDRVVTWTSGAGLSIYALGADQPLGTAPAPVDEPRGVAWVGDKSNLLVWTKSALQLIDGDKVSTRWTTELSQHSQPDVLVMADPPEFNLLGPWSPARGGFMVNRSVYVRHDSNTFDESETIGGSDAPEIITSVKLIGETAVLSTSTGRVAAVDLANGAITWQIRLSDRPPDHLEANDDFTVIESCDGRIAQMLILDTRTGRMLALPSLFDDQNKLPVNLALGDDGILAVTRNDTLVMIDLFEIRQSSIKSQIADAPQGSDPQLFWNMNRPGQILVHSGQVLALCHEGRSLRGYDEQSGQVRDFDRETGARDTSSTEEVQKSLLCLSGKSVYVWNPRLTRSYDLESADQNWELRVVEQCAADELLLGKDFLLLLSRPQHSQPIATEWWLCAFNRTLPNKHVGGQNDDAVVQTVVTDPRGIVQWQAVDGGLCYLSGDHSVHFLQGKRNLAPPN
jgi:outer membrane protein assembly factor BamB/tetratricopeptide (TPR) repeat protein